ncbi:MAG TPA: hypothetical protein DFR83_03680 [Deltaproteobacteria bacterium]|mgnify:CR=1 FL=1|nr:hypothetical protein [Deltaproteobacteria bacterium]
MPIWNRSLGIIGVALASLSAPDAIAAEDGEELTRKPLVWLQTMATVAPTYTSSLNSQPASMVIAGDLGVRIGGGFADWRGEAQVFPGFSNRVDQIDFGHVFSGWVRRETPRPSFGEASVLSFGASYTMLDQSPGGRVIASSIDVGRRLSLDGADLVQVGQEPGVPLAQWIICWAEQVHLFNDVFAGPAVRIGIGNSATASDVGAGLEISSIF